MSDYQDRDYEDVCIICCRPESKAGRMFHLPNNITVCDDCMHMTMETVSHMDMNGVFPGMGAMDMQVFMNSMNAVLNFATSVASTVEENRRGFFGNRG